MSGYNPRNSKRLLLSFGMSAQKKKEADVPNLAGHASSRGMG
jgi:hypothetical protein